MNWHCAGSALPKTLVLMAHWGTYCRSIRRPPPACQSSHSGSIPGARTAQSGLSRGAEACGAPRRLHLCFQQRSAERRGPVRSATCGISFTCQSSGGIRADPHKSLHQACQRKLSVSQVFQIKSNSDEFCIIRCCMFLETQYIIL